MRRRGDAVFENVCMKYVDRLHVFRFRFRLQNELYEYRYDIYDTIYYIINK